VLPLGGLKIVHEWLDKVTKRRLPPSGEGLTL
jgi:hypothetical protein